MYSPFLSLPLEIRRPIYRYCLPYSLLDSRKDQHSRLITRAEDDLIRWYSGTCPSILFVNRQTHAEAGFILYYENTFSVYVRHPRHARLPLNESRPDEDSFILISWKHRNWAHPRNPKIPLAVVRNHRHFSNICRVHVILPLLADLAAADLYMRTTSYASHHGISAWLKKIRGSDGKPSEQDQRRMDYIALVKGPIDEVAEALQELPQIREIAIFFTSQGYEIAIYEFIIAALLKLRSVQRAQLLHRTVPLLNTWITEQTRIRLVMMEPRLRELEGQMESALVTEESEIIAGLCPEALEMLELLRTTRKTMLFFRQSSLESPVGDIDLTMTVPFLGRIPAE